MQRSQLLDAVARYGRFDSREAAERATVATLETLGERVSRGEAAALGSALPEEYAATVRGRSDETPAAFSPDEFVRRVIEREATDVGRDRATIHVRAVMAALADAGLSNELRDAREQLPNEYATLFETDDLGE